MPSALLALLFLIAMAFASPLANEEDNGDSEEIDFVDDITEEGEHRIQKRQVRKNIWAPMPIPYTFYANVKDTKKATIRAAVKFWEDNTCVRFQENGEGNNRIMINGTGACSSVVGMDGGKQTMRVAHGCYACQMVHEMMNTLGATHMQNREDRDQYITINWDNLNPGSAYNYKITSQATHELLGLPYEFGSVMHYSAMSRNINKDVSVLVAKAPYQMYQNSMNGRMPTFLDIKMINTRYNCYEQCPKPQVQCWNLGEVDVNDCSKCKCPMGWAGNTCAERPANTTVFNAATTSAKYSIKMRETTEYTSDDLDYHKDYYVIQAPFLHKVEVNISPKNDAKDSCSDRGVEVKFRSDVRFSGVT